MALDRAHEALVVQARACHAMGSPLYGTLLERCAAARDAGTMLGLLAACHQDRDIIAAGGVLKLLAAVHEMALEGRAPSLAAHYPSCGGDGDLDAAWDAFVDTIRGATTEISLALDRPLQTNEIGRAAPLLGGFLWVAERFGLPLRLLEVGASAGLLLRWDHYRYEAPSWSWGNADARVRLDRHFTATAPPFSTETRVQIVERRGCDLEPIDGATPAGRCKLTSFVWPDQQRRLADLRAACDVAETVPATVDRASAPSWLRARLERLVHGATTVVYHTIMRQYLSSDDREALDLAIADAAQRATTEAPVAYLTLEPEPERKANVLLRVHPGDIDIEIASSSFHGMDVSWAAQRARFG